MFFFISVMEVELEGKDEGVDRYEEGRIFAQRQRAQKASCPDEEEFLSSGTKEREPHRRTAKEHGGD